MCVVCEKDIRDFEYYVINGDDYVHLECLPVDKKRHLEGLAQFDF
jgi:hypothetical protein